MKKYGRAWFEQVSEINVTEMRIDLVQDAKPFNSEPFQSGPNTHELERAEIYKHLKTVVIEPSISDWDTPVLFVPKKDGKLCFCSDYRKLN